MSWLFSEVILRNKCHFKRNLGSPVKNCPKVSLICLSESGGRGSFLIGCDIYWRPSRHILADEDKDKLNKLDRIEENKSEDNL